MRVLVFRKHLIIDFMCKEVNNEKADGYDGNYNDAGGSYCTWFT